MSTNHGEKEMQKPISEYAKYMKNLLPVNIPANYKLKPLIERIAGEDRIRSGVHALRDFFHLFFDRLISDGHLYVKPQKTRNPNDYQFLHNMNHLLIDMGYHSKLADSGDSLLISKIPSFTTSKNKIPVSKHAKCLRFLTLCGFSFVGTDNDAMIFNVSQEHVLEVSYPNNPDLLIGLKVLSIADMELRTERRYSNDDNLLRCDYSLIKDEAHWEMENTEYLRAFLQKINPDLIISSLTGNIKQQYAAHVILKGFLDETGGRIVFISTANVFDGALIGDNTEKDTPCPASKYGCFKVACEELFGNLNERSLNVRLPKILAQKDADYMVEQAVSGKPVYSNLYFNLSTPSYAVVAIKYCVDQEKYGVMHLVSNDNISVDECTCSIMSQMGKSDGYTPQILAPKALCEMYELLDASQLRLSKDGNMYLTMVCMDVDIATQFNFSCEDVISTLSILKAGNL